MTVWVAVYGEIEKILRKYTSAGANVFVLSDRRRAAHAVGGCVYVHVCPQCDD